MVLAGPYLSDGTFVSNPDAKEEGREKSFGRATFNGKILGRDGDNPASATVSTYHEWGCRQPNGWSVPFGAPYSLTDNTAVSSAAGNVCSVRVDDIGEFRIQSHVPRSGIATELDSGLLVCARAESVVRRLRRATFGRAGGTG